MSGLLTATADVPSKALLRSSNSGDFVVPATRLRLGDRAFSVAAARAWNVLPHRLATAFKPDIDDIAFSSLREDELHWASTVNSVLHETQVFADDKWVS